MLYKHFLYVNNFRHADILNIHKYAVWLTLFYFCKCLFILKYFWFEKVKNTSSNSRLFSVLLKWKEINFRAWASFVELLLNGSMKKRGIIEHFSWVNLRMCELTFNNYSVPSFFPYIYEPRLNANICSIF